MFKKYYYCKCAAAFSRGCCFTATQIHFFPAQFKWIQPDCTTSQFGNTSPDIYWFIYTAFHSVFYPSQLWLMHVLLSKVETANTPKIKIINIIMISLWLWFQLQKYQNCSFTSTLHHFYVEDFIWWKHFFFVYVILVMFSDINMVHTITWYIWYYTVPP